VARHTLVVKYPSVTGRSHAAVELYTHALERVVAAGYAAEIEWQRSRDPDALTETDFLREVAWVILCSGFSESTVRRKFPHLSLCFCDWLSASEIASSAQLCRRTALECFANARKVDAIVSAALIVSVSGFESVHARLARDPIRTLQRFDQLGGVTAYHVAKNFGYQVVKPDRHLVRLSDRLGFKDAAGLCDAISSATGASLNTVDIVLWRYCALGFERHQSH
jgi:hypothetical protein